MFTDGSVLRDGSAAAACIAPQLGSQRQCRLWYCASSTKAEPVGLLLAADNLSESTAVKSAAVFCESKTGPESAREEGTWPASGSARCAQPTGPSRARL
ncbi:hypothetical protein MRX96_004234 [Rhipicephalus microplus]